MLWATTQSMVRSKVLVTFSVTSLFLRLVTLTYAERKPKPPVLVTIKRTKTSPHLSNFLYVTVKLGASVGVGGGVKAGSGVRLPETFRLFSNIHQPSSGLFRVLTKTKPPPRSRATISTVSPALKVNTRSYIPPGPVRQLTSLCTSATGISAVGVRDGSGVRVIVAVVAGVGVSVGSAS